MSEDVIAEASVLIRENNFVAAVEQLDAARRALSSVEAMSEGLPPATAQPLKPDGETAVSERQQGKGQREREVNAKDAVPEMEEIFTDEYHGVLARTMSTDDVVSYMQRVSRTAFCGSV